VATVQRALELGVRYFDTAPFYGRGLSQAVLGEALQDRTEDYVLATKIGRLRTPEELEENVEAASAGSLPSDIHQALENLVVDPVGQIPPAKPEA
jgi:D-threo-aldose 1-dehydrogenase